jgi:uncharacterized OB-fold protein
VPDELSAPFWQAASEERLVIPRCRTCAVATFPPDVLCSACGCAEGFEFVPHHGAGTVRSWTVMRQSFLPGFEDDVPFVLVDVELTDADGVRLIGRLVHSDQSDLRLGAPAHIAWELLPGDLRAPAFELTERSVS